MLSGFGFLNVDAVPSTVYTFSTVRPLCILHDS